MWNEENKLPEPKTGRQMRFQEPGAMLPEDFGADPVRPLHRPPPLAVSPPRPHFARFGETQTRHLGRRPHPREIKSFRSESIRPLQTLPPPVSSQLVAN